MAYQNVFIESIGFTLPEQVVTTAELESRLGPLYQRLRLPEGRLELISGVRERRFWAPDSLPSDQSILSGQRALTVAGLEPHKVGALIHASVCRDYLEPATACKVHHALGLNPAAYVFDVSNACLGILNGMQLIANMIELGQISAGMVVGTESSRQLVETTIDALNSDLNITRQTIKSAIASLTIGSASCAVLLTDKQLTRTGNRLLQVTARAETQHHGLCHSDRDQAIGSGMQPLMNTDSERLLHSGIETGLVNFAEFLHDTGWTRDDIHKTVCHQVGLAHRKRMLEKLQLDPQRDFATVEWLGNTGSAALPVTLGLALHDGFIQAGNRLALLGIGSGINSLMVGIEWQTTRVLGNAPQVNRAPAVNSAPHTELQANAGRSSELVPAPHADFAEGRKPGERRRLLGEHVQGQKGEQSA